MIDRDHSQAVGRENKAFRAAMPAPVIEIRFPPFSSAVGQLSFVIAEAIAAQAFAPEFPRRPQVLARPPTGRLASCLVTNFDGNWRLPVRFRLRRISTNSATSILGCNFSLRSWTADSHEAASAAPEESQAVCRTPSAAKKHAPKIT